MGGYNPRTANGHRRRELRARVLAEETHCGICGRMVDKSLTVVPDRHGRRCPGPECQGCIPHPLRAEVDEITPVSRGGSPYDRDNCRLAHRICNQKRGDGRRERARAAAQRTVVASDLW